MNGALVVLRADLVIYAPPVDLSERACGAMLAQLDDALPGVRVVLLPGPLDVLDALGDDDLAEVALRIRSRIAPIEAGGVPA